MGNAGRDLRDPFVLLAWLEKSSILKATPTLSGILAKRDSELVETVNHHDIVRPERFSRLRVLVHRVP